MTQSTTDHTYTFTTGPDEARHTYVTERLKAFNRARLPTDRAREPLEIYVLDSTGRVVGGLVGGTVWGWLEVAVLWVDESLRGQGLGKELMRRAESEARQRGCVAARLSTWDFQALGFYERLGYLPYGRLDGYPAGHTVHYLRKDLTE
jgi:ribosomal protein S18 acetylase RimI-like enzyme